NTSGGALTLVNNNAININNDLTFTGSSDLNLGTGTMTLGGSGSARTVTLAAGTLTTGAIKSATVGLNLVGPGTYTIVPAGTDNNNVALQTNVAGTLTVGAGAQINTGQIDSFFGGLSGFGTVANGSATTRWITAGTNNLDTTYNGVLIDGGTGRLGL